MAYPILKRRDEALDAADTAKRLRKVLGQEVLLDTRDEFGAFTVTVAPRDWVRTLETLRDDDLLAYDMFDCLFGVDRSEAGFDIVAIVYSTSKGRRIHVVVRCDGGREAPHVPSAIDVYRGVDFMEREAWDMFGIEFDGHPGVAPRLLCVENFEGWPLRKDFFLVSREVKPWPGIKEPAETDEDGNVIERIPGPGGAPGPSGLDELMAAQAKLVANPAVEAGDEAAAAATASGGREEVEMDQAVYDQLIAEGKSERVARSKAKRAAMKAGGSAKEPAASPDELPASEPAVERAEVQAEVAETEAATAVAAEATSLPINDEGDQYDQATYDEQIAADKPERVAMSKARRAAGKMDTSAPAPAAAEKPQATGQAEAPTEVEAPAEAAPPAEPEPSAADKADAGRQAQADARAEKAAEQAESIPAAAEDAPAIPEGAPIETETTPEPAADVTDVPPAPDSAESDAEVVVATDAESDGGSDAESDGGSDGGSDAEVVVATDDDGNEYDQTTYNAEIAKGKPERVALSKAKRALARHRGA